MDPTEPFDPPEPDVAWLDDAPDVPPRAYIQVADNLFDDDGSDPWLQAWWTTETTPPWPEDLPIETCVRTATGAPWPALRTDVAPITVRIGDQDHALTPAPDRPGVLRAPLATYPDAGVAVSVVGHDLQRPAPAPLRYDEPTDWMRALIEPGEALRIAWTPAPASEAPPASIVLNVIAQDAVVLCHLHDDGEATLPASAREPAGWGMLIGRVAFATGEIDQSPALLVLAQVRQFTLRIEDEPD